MFGYKPSQNERDLFRSIGDSQRPQSSSVRGVTVSGLPGSGKSTLVTELAKQSWLQPVIAYVENPFANPYLARGTDDMASRQNWFLQKYYELSEQNNPVKFIVLDQDPRVVVLVYSKIFTDFGWMSTKQLDEQLRFCSDVLNAFSARTERWDHIILTAPPDVLLSRTRNRKSDTELLGIIFDRVVERFEEYLSILKEAYPMTYHECDSRSSIEELIQLIKTSLTTSDR